MENNETQAVKQKTPLTKQEKVRRGLLIGISSLVIVIIILGLVIGSPYSIKKNDYESFEAMTTEHYDRPTVLMMSKKSCPYCKKVYPGLSELKDEYEDRVNFYYIDIHDGGEGTQLYNRYRPSADPGKDGVPTVWYFRPRASLDEDLSIYAKYTNYGGKDELNTKGQIEGVILKLLELTEEMKSGE